VFGAAEAVSHDTPPEALAWRLLRQSLTRALAELVAETLANQPPASGDEQHLNTRLELAIEAAITNEALRVDLDFFENPAALPLLAGVKRILGDWLHRFCVFSEPDAASVAKRLPSFFHGAPR
jgi:hypothetical protein